MDHAGPYSRELEVATGLARAAGLVALRYHGQTLDVARKANNEPVTVADHACSAVIVEGLRAAFPSDVVISEELADDPRRLTVERVWYVDPIDGTKSFIRAASSYCIMIGLAIAHRPVLGVLFQPNHKTLIAACAGQGSYCSHQQRLYKMETSQCSTPGEARLLTLSSNPPADRRKMEECFGLAPTEAIGSIGMKLAGIALGASDLYANPATRCSSWDTCAPQVVLEEAGGQVSNVHGEPLRYDNPNGLRHTRGLLASNGSMHEAALARLAILFPDRS